MTVPNFSSDEMIDYIKAHGWALESSDFWEENNVLIFTKNDSEFFFQYDTTKKYFYTETVKMCGILKIPPPEEHIHQYFLHHKKQQDICYCGSPDKFIDCHGKD